MLTGWIVRVGSLRQPKFGPGPEIWSQRSPGRIPAFPLVGWTEGPEKSLQGWTAIFLAHRLALRPPSPVQIL